ncbi:MAG: hypothetical protein AAGA12_10355 [Pseudomonadota bacterium]
MTIIRPEAAAFLSRWSEFLASVVIMLLGVWALLQAGWLLQVTGGGIGLIGAALAFTAFRRQRFRQSEQGPGLIELDERQLSYFAPYDGGAVSLDMLARVTISTSATSPALWTFEEDGGRTLAIPAHAAQADLLFDALASLPAVDYERAADALAHQQDDHFVIWAKDRALLH